MENLNTKIVSEVIKQSPGHKNPVHYLMKILSISRETVYRRIRNEIPFSINEVAAIAEYFNLSIDQLLDLKSSNRFPFSKEFDAERNPEDVYSDLLKDDIEIMEKLRDSSRMKITAVMNRIPFRFLPYPALFKFDYYQYLYSAGKISLMSTRFSDIEIPAAINDLHEKASSYLNCLNHVTCVIDSVLYTNIIKKIQFYRRLRFLSVEDLQILQKELFDLLVAYEDLLRNGKNNAGSDYVFYYSFFTLESNMIFIEYDDNTLLQIWIYPESPLVIKNNQQVNDIQKHWIDSKIRNSMLITKTADIQQIEMLRDVYRQISELGSYE